jgi:hypothetical protein
VVPAALEKDARALKTWIRARGEGLANAVKYENAGAALR